MKIEKINLVGSTQAKKEAKAPKAVASNNSQKEIKELSNACYKPIAFGRKLQEHRSWGARINPDTKEASFKLFTYPDATSVSVLILDKKDKDKSPLKIELENKGKGVFEKTGISPDKVQNGYRYLYEVTLKDGTKELIKDPYTFKQDSLNGPSTVYDHSLYNWQHDDEWKKNPNRITRTSNGKDGHLSVRQSRIYALSPDTISDKRSYDAVKESFKHIKEAGFNTVEIMHVENTFSFNWGYDGVDKHAPSAYLGGPDALKGLVDEAHKEGLNVVFDVIPNHMGPDGNQLGRSGPYIKGPNDFGDALNYEGKNSEYVRDYMVNAMMNWFDNYHVDGLRMDMTKYMESDYTLKQIAAEVNYHYPDGYLIAEDGRAGVSVNDEGHFWANEDEIHDKRVVNKLLPEEYGKGKDEDAHSAAIQTIIDSKANLSRLGLDSEWDFSYYHQLDSCLYSPNTTKFIKAMLCSQDGVKYTASHDEIGNFEGTRKLAKLMVPKLRLNDNITLTVDDMARGAEYATRKNQRLEDALQTMTFQKAQFVAEELAIKYQTGELDKYEIKPEASFEEANKLRQALRNEVLTPLGISPTSRISHRRIKNSFEKSYEQNKMALALTYAIPGAKMTFQGDERADLTPFRFFRRFESVPYEEYLYTEKGYAPAEAALEESTIGKIPYSKKGQERMRHFENLTKDLNKLNAENKSLSVGHIDPKTIVDHNQSNVVAFNSKDKSSNNEIFTITNFGEADYRDSKDNEYWIRFPKGRWVEVLNTDDEKYGGTSRHLNTGEVIHGNGHSNNPINLAGYSTICFKRIG